ncbi:glutaredoxin [Galendromus occidentalis]|uniref:Glutaredoxin n=1 Tax=Galendromus occidentalis TaxID=34638 RepID=A0AAJ6QML8_9ACAR|nr:glutaredoxin [Galendromus occidentalis]
MNAAATREFLKRTIKTTSVLLLSKADCPRCQKVESLFNHYQTKPKIVHVDSRYDEQLIYDSIRRMTGSSDLPKLFIGGSFFGSSEEIEALHKEGVLSDLVTKASAYSVKHVLV